jgi:S-ribosylhomocysteine lyase
MCRARQAKGIGDVSMAKVESFELDHTKVLAPYVRLAGVSIDSRESTVIEMIEKGVDPEKANEIVEFLSTSVVKYDLRFKQPNQGFMETAGMHSLEHLLATYLRDHLDGFIDISPMGCRTGFYLTVWNSGVSKFLLQYDYEKNEKVERYQATAKVRDALVTTLEYIASDEVTEVPATTEKSCGNYIDHSLAGAKEYAKEALAQGFSTNAFEREL